jgi:N-succinyldiaminopimelate aminotransferase
VPRHPGLSAPVRALPASVFDRLWPRLRQSGHEIAPLHIGDTCLSPPPCARLGALGFTAGDEPELYRYAPSAGRIDLLETITRKVQGINQLAWCGPEHVQVTSGATHGLSLALRATCDPGDELLIMAPYWPLIRGIARSVGLVPVEVPFSQRLYEEPGADVAALIAPFVTPRTAALYFATPNNPDGKVHGRRELEGIAAVARRHDLWVVADEVYEHYTYEGREHLSIGALPGMEDRTCTVFSFSKSFGQGGLRVGYLVAPRELISTCRWLTLHSIYAVPVAMQRAAHAALERGGEFITEARVHYRAARDRAAAQLAAPARVPEGAQYLFVDLRAFVRDGDDGAIGVLERLADVGVMLSPGVLYGASWSGFARLCYTAVQLDALDRAIERINRVLASG